ncbi:MAG: hypothetical protein WA936_14265 [Erythrobacter sp.]|uniref:hypothetical protein n=1 Tax=Erythrobacter sp. TaxID=1042 RepID=UPI003C7794F4
MARAGIGYFDHSGHFHKTPQEATLRDLADVLGRVGEREGLSAGIAQILLEKRYEIEKVFFEHDAMLAEQKTRHADEQDHHDLEERKNTVTVFSALG